MRLHSTFVIAVAAACRIEPNPAFDEPTPESTSSDGGSSTSTAAIDASTDTSDGSSSDPSSGSSGEVPEGCYDGVVVAGELCFAYRGVTLGQDAWAVATGDFDGDDNPDALVGGYASAQIFYGDGYGDFWGVRTLYASGTAGGNVVTGAVAIDLNGDGLSDPVLSYGDGNAIDVFVSYEDGSFAEAQAYVVGAGPQRVVAADVDADGRLDVVTATKIDNQVVVLYGTGDGSLEAEAPIDVGTTPQSLAVADLRGEGFGDVVVAPTAESSVGVLVNQGGQTFEALDPGIEIGTNPITVLLSDLDLDGHPDMFVSTVSQENFVLYGVEGGLFTDEGLWWNWTGRIAFAAAAGDFNADGIVDIAWAEGYMGNGGMTWMLGKGDRWFEATLNPLFTFPIDLAVADFNHDGIDDVVLANINSGLGLGILLSVP